MTNLSFRNILLIQKDPWLAKIVVLGREVAWLTGKSGTSGSSDLTSNLARENIYHLSLSRCIIIFVIKIQRLHHTAGVCSWLETFGIPLRVEGIGESLTDVLRFLTP